VIFLLLNIFNLFWNYDILLIGDFFVRESYSYKDILFGLYNEYVMLQEQLDYLNKYVLLEENNLDEVKFRITKEITDDKVRMLCYLYDEKTKIERLLEKLNVIEYGNFKASYVDEEDYLYEILQYPEVIDKTKQQEFSQSVWYILNTDFCKNMKWIYCGTGYSNIPFLSVNPRGLFTNLNDVGILDFNCCRDLHLHAYIDKGRLNKDKMEFMLNMEFSKKRFPEYYQNLIEETDTFGKDVEIYGDFRYSKNGKFEIVPESKRLVLVKK